MQTFTRMLVALDASARASAVLEAAVKLGELTGAKLVLYRAIHVAPDLPPQLFNTTDESVEDFLLVHTRRELESSARSVRHGLIERYVAAWVVPWEGICGAARTYECDLIVMGSHGYGIIDQLLGTTASRVVNRTDRNVLVVRAHA